ncbi:MAG: hypothetical protein A3F83_01675 [Candidatus Glassbacteria bacterium RIFCSPLOWO2_12_FULL_58_11]|uniref:Porin n=1 Tax=Candidatus Glassbacteria bacterium RIFCSPLOWO2_12_FULL_58_11 TaxID=1817867 RepID=A0A1F5YUV8_9BACT|nr:MAG: hypothetical protein A3F83_01675 [Candidatus Glassbacteria bacterium RIFCSPLOWO2_12_FULL_58_11]
MTSIRLVLTSLVAGIMLGRNPVYAEVPPVDTTGERWQELDQKIRILERKFELEKEKADSAAARQAVLEAGEKGFVIRSADGSYQLKLRGYMQADGRLYYNDDEQPATNDILLRRVRTIFEGTLNKYTRFRIMPDFGQGKTVLQDSYIEFAYWPAAQLRAGKFKPPLGLERLKSGANLLFIERGQPTSLVPNRDLGIQLGGALAKGSLEYAVGLFNGASDGGSTDGDSNDDKDLVGRVFAHPFRKAGADLSQGLGVGIAGSVGHQKGGLPSFSTPGQRTFFSYRTDAIADGRRWRLSPQFYYYQGPLGLLGEYVRSVQETRKGTETANLANTAWQLAASWVVTGGEASFTDVKPKRPFNPRNGVWGAVELAARYHELQVDKAAFPVFADPAKAAGKAAALGVGVNWYLDRQLKVSAGYEQTAFDRGGATGDRESEKVLLIRFQVAY